MGLANEVTITVEFAVSIECNNDEIDWFKKEYGRLFRLGLADYRGTFTNNVALFSSYDIYEHAPQRLANLLKKFLYQKRRHSAIGFTYARSMSHYIGGGFWGGAYFVTPHRIYHYTTADWLAKRTDIFQKKTREK